MLGGIWDPGPVGLVVLRLEDGGKTSLKTECTYQSLWENVQPLLGNTARPFRADSKMAPGVLWGQDGGAGTARPLLTVNIGDLVENLVTFLGNYNLCKGL